MKSVTFTEGLFLECAFLLSLCPAACVHHIICQTHRQSLMPCVRTFHTHLCNSSNLYIDLSASFPLLFSVSCVIVARISTASPLNMRPRTHLHAGTHAHTCKHTHTYTFSSPFFLLLFCLFVLRQAAICSLGIPGTYYVV